MAPEVIDNTGIPTPYGHAVDIWGLGITVIEMAEAGPPLEDMPPLGAMLLIPTRPPPTLRPGVRASSNLVNFLAAALAKEPGDRPTAAQLAQHPFVREGEATVEPLVQMLEEHSALVSTESASWPLSRGTTDSLSDWTLQQHRSVHESAAASQELSELEWGTTASLATDDASDGAIPLPSPRVWIRGACLSSDESEEPPLPPSGVRSTSTEPALPTLPSAAEVRRTPAQTRAVPLVATSASRSREARARRRGRRAVQLVERFPGPGSRGGRDWDQEEDALPPLPGAATTSPAGRRVPGGLTAPVGGPAATARFAEIRSWRASLAEIRRWQANEASAASVDERKMEEAVASCRRHADAAIASAEREAAASLRDLVDKQFPREVDKARRKAATNMAMLSATNEAELARRTHAAGSDSAAAAAVRAALFADHGRMMVVQVRAHAASYARLRVHQLTRRAAAEAETAASLLVTTLELMQVRHDAERVALSAAHKAARSRATARRDAELAMLKRRMADDERAAFKAWRAGAEYASIIREAESELVAAERRNAGVGRLSAAARRRIKAGVRVAANVADARQRAAVELRQSGVWEALAGHRAHADGLLAAAQLRAVQRLAAVQATERATAEGTMAEAEARRVAACVSEHVLLLQQLAAEEMADVVAAATPALAAVTGACDERARLLGAQLDSARQRAADAQRAAVGTHGTPGSGTDAGGHDVDEPLAALAECERDRRRHLRTIHEAMVGPGASPLPPDDLDAEAAAALAARAANARLKVATDEAEAAGAASVAAARARAAAVQAKHRTHLEELVGVQSEQWGLSSASSPTSARLPRVVLSTLSPLPTDNSPRSASSSTDREASSLSARGASSTSARSPGRRSTRAFSDASATMASLAAAATVAGSPVVAKLRSRSKRKGKAKQSTGTQPGEGG